MRPTGEEGGLLLVVHRQQAASPPARPNRMALAAGLLLPAAAPTMAASRALTRALTSEAEGSISSERRRQRPSR